MADATGGSGNPFAAPATAARSPLLRPGPNRYAGFWWRVLAALIDSLVVAPATLVAVANQWWWRHPGITAASLLAYPAYKVVMDAVGGTLGKRSCGILVIDAAARYPGLRRSLSRNAPVVAAAVIDLARELLGRDEANDADPATVGWMVAMMGMSRLIWLVLAVDALSVGLSRQKRALHDRWAGTWCIRPRLAEPDAR